MQLKDISKIIKNRFGGFLAGMQMCENIRSDIMKILTVADAIEILKQEYDIHIAIIDGRRVLRCTEREPTKATPVILTTTLKIPRTIDL